MIEFLANALLFIHAAFVGFVVFGLVLTVVGFFRNWGWVRNWWFRISHLCAMGVVVVQAWCGIACPLTVWEHALRESVSGRGYDTPFVVYWLQHLIYYDYPMWVFTFLYTVCGLVVLVTWLKVPPERRQVWRRS